MATSLPPTRLDIKGVNERVERIREHIRRDLPSHEGITGAAARVADAAHAAERISRQMQRPLSLHRLPALFLAAALLFLAGWVYWQLFYVATLTLALPDRDAVLLKERVAEGDRMELSLVPVPGSREAVAAVSAGEVDLAFVQGGLDIPKHLPRLETPAPELVLWFVKDGVAAPSGVHKILTSTRGEGSHSVAELFCRAWGLSAVEYVHDWGALTREASYRVPADIDAVFVVKDPGDEATLAAAAKLGAAGFRLLTPALGARAEKLDFLRPKTIPAGYLASTPPLPQEPVETYAVATFLVAREGLTPRELALAGHLLDDAPTTISQSGYELTLSDASDLFQGAEAFLGMVINLGLAFLALLGIEMIAYRKRFHELNSLISLISMLQSDKDVLGLRGAEAKAKHLLYLGLCSDLLGLISVISGYYTQENSALLFTNLAEVIHQRCDGMKINIQLKILHATVDVPGDHAEAASAETSAPQIEVKPAPRRRQKK
jgi:hypothetical protein